MIDKGAIFSEDRRYRYQLWRVWDPGGPRAMIIGLNPSTADEGENDPTIRNLPKLLEGFGGFYMMNLFAVLSSDPEYLRVCADPLRDNDIHLDIIAGRCNAIIFAWGNFKQAEYRSKLMKKKFPDALCFGKNANGSPIHPLSAAVWQKKKAKLQPF